MAVSSLQLFNFVLVMIAFSITGGNAIQQIAKQACFIQGKTVDEANDDQACLGSGSGGVWQAILIFTACEWAICMAVKTLSGSTLSSVLGMVCAVIYSLVAMVRVLRTYHRSFVYSFILSRAPDRIRSHWIALQVISFCNIPPTGAAGSVGGVVYSTADKIFGIFNALGQIASAFGLALILLEITDTLRQPPPPVKTMIKTTWWSLTTCLVLYMLVACGGYASQGDGVSSNILDSFDGPHWALILANAALLINMVASYQIFAQALFDAVESWIKYFLDRKQLRKQQEGAQYLGRVNEEEGQVCKAEDGVDGVNGVDGARDGKEGGDEDVLRTEKSVFGFDLTSNAELCHRRSHHGSSVHELDLRYTRSFVAPPESLESRTTSRLVEYATARRTIKSGWTNENVLSNTDGVFLPLWIRAIERTIIVGIVALIGCIMPFFGSFVGGFLRHAKGKHNLRDPFNNPIPLD